MNKIQKIHKLFFLLLCFSFFLSSQTVKAEIIKLKNGNVIETKILKEGDDFLTVEAKGGKVKIPRSDVEMIWRGSQAEFLEVSGNQVHFTKGVALYKEGKFLEAADSFHKALGPQTMNAVIYANLGSAYAAAKIPANAEANFLKALEQTPDNIDLLQNAAHFYETEKQFQKAIPYYQKLVTLKPHELTFKRNLAFCFYMTGDYLAAAKRFEELGQKNDTIAGCNAAAAFIQAGALDQAWVITERLLESPAPIPRAYLHRAEILRLRKDYAQAEIQYQEALTRDPNDPQALLGLGQLYFEKKEWDRAEMSFQQALEKDPQNSGATYGLAQTFAQKKDSAKAISYYEQLLKKDPHDFALQNDMGLFYLKINQPQKALKVFQKIFLINDRYAKAHANAGLAHAFLGDVDNAFKEWNRALALDPHLKEAAQNKKLLEEVMNGNRDEKKKQAA